MALIVVRKSIRRKIASNWSLERKYTTQLRMWHIGKEDSEIALIGSSTIGHRDEWILDSG